MNRLDFHRMLSRKQSHITNVVNADIRPHGGIDNSGDPVITTVVEAGIFYKMEGEATLNEAKDFINPENGRLTYIGDKPAIFYAVATLGYTSNMNNHDITFQLRKNGEPQIPGQATVRKTTGADIDAVSLDHPMRLSKGDYVEVWVTASIGNVQIIKSPATITIFMIS